MNKAKTTALLCALTGLAGVAFAQSSPLQAPSPLSPIYACAEKTDPVERLACFDAAVATIRGAEARSEIVTFDKQRVETVRREAFGFNMPSLPRLGLPSFGKKDGAGNPLQAANEPIEEQVFAVARVSTSGDRATIYLENGQVWRLVETGELNAPRRTPYNVIIRSASMGSFILSVEGRNKGYRVRRVE
jgi:hypothetical protein